MDRKFDESGKTLMEVTARSPELNRLKSPQWQGYLITILLTCGVLASHGQPIQPEVLFEFPYGIGSYLRGPEYPYGNLIEGNDGNFYGTTSSGGPSNFGTVFKMTTNGVLTSLFAFNNTNGATPYAGLALGSDGNFYGTTSNGGTNGLGTVFKVTAEGALTTLVSFNGTNGANPQAALTLGSDGNFYGTTVAGGSYAGYYNFGNGTIFKVTPDGALTTLVSFEYANGANPQGSLALGPDGNFYGTTSSGGSNSYGTVFKLTMDGKLTSLVSFNYYTNGASPRTGLTLGNDGNFYGTTAEGGSASGSGTVFRMTTNGVLTKLVTLNYPTAAGPAASLTLGNDGNFYGTTSYGGGNSGYGTIFRVTTNGAFSVRVSFNGANGVEPHSGLTLGSDGNFYGTAAAGGGGGDTGGGVGTFFRMSPTGSFTKLASFGKSVGSSPRAPLTLGNDGYYYGTTMSGGSNGYGMIFRMTTNGAVSTLASFNNANGAYPHAGLTMGPDGNYYGTTSDGGSAGVGTVFRVTTNGTLTRLVSFTGANGSYPQAALTLGNDGNFYGTTAYSSLTSGSPQGGGTVFKVTTNGTLTRLVLFNNTNGAQPLGALTLGGDGSFYGTTWRGGSGGGGTVFKITTNGTLTTLASFNITNRQYPQGTLTLGSDGNFYGLTGSGLFNGTATPSGTGTVFRVTTEGTLTTLTSFTNTGDWLMPALTMGPDGNFYGTTGGGSSINSGTVFQVNTNGAFATLVSFNGTNGAVPNAPLTVGRDGNIYGTTSGGGSTLWDGTIYRLSPLAPVVFGQPQPANQVVPAGIDITITANVFGALPMSFQWVFNGSDRPGATNSWLALNTAPGLSGSYALRVSNHLGTALSSNATVKVMPALITNLPVTGMTASGALINASVTLGREDTLAWIEWGTNTTYGRIAGVTNISGGSSTTRLTGALTGLDETQVNYYRVVASNSFGIVYGPDQTLQVGSIYGYAQSVLADEPLVFYRFDETNGAIAANSGFLGEPFNATYSTNFSLGVPSLTPKFGYAAEFNNTNSSVGVPALGIYDQITIEAWLKPRSFPGNETYDSIYTTDIWSPGALHTHLVDLNAPFHRWQLAIHGSDTYNGSDFFEAYVGSEGLFLTNTWVHLAASYDSTTKTMVTYVNGRPYGTNTVPNAKPLNLAAAHIGAWIGSYYPSQPTSAQNWFDGQIDEFAIYPTALTSDRIRAHFEAAGNPLILAQPSSRTNDFGSTASFSVRAGVTSPFIYQWLKNGVPLADGLLVSGAFSPTLTLTNVAGAQEGDYSLWIRNASGSVTSVVARLVVVDPLITLQPTNQVAELAGNTIFTVTAVGTPPLSYQWLKEGVPIAQATKTSLTLTNLQPPDAGRYAVVVSNLFASTTSEVASLTVNLVAVDPTFNSGVNQSPLAFAIQADGKILAGGSFISFGGLPRTNIVRLNADGSVDSSFNPGTDGGINSLAIQADGKILVGGYFTTLAGQPRNYLGRLNVDGSLDATFNPGTNGVVNSLAIQADGKILVGGIGQSRSGVGRLNLDGSLDPTFDTGGYDPYNYPYIYSLIVQADGKILVGGNFSTLFGQPRNGIGRLNADGSLDTTFDLGENGPSHYYPYVDTLALQADGKFLLGGQFFKLGEQPRKAIRRFNADGSLDTTFNPGPGGYYQGFYSVALQADGKILVGGNFDSLGGQPRYNIARLNSDGSADLTFNPLADGWGVYSLAVQADGQILVGGQFTVLDGQSHTNLARLNNTGLATQNLTYDDSILLWQRGGTCPEVSRTAFEMTTNNLDWTSLGSGVRVPGGWQLTGVSLPPACTVRARGYANAGYHNSSSWFVEDYWGSLLVAYQPESRTNNAGTTAFFSVAAGGTEPLQYQWFKNGVALADGVLVGGAQTATLTLSSVLKADEGAYSLVITNSSGSITSAVARLEVVDPVIAVQPTNQIAELNGSVTLSVVGVGTPPVNYQWFKDGLPLPGVTDANLSLTNLQLVDAGSYSAVVSNQFGSLTSAVAFLTVNGATIDPILNLEAGGDYYPSVNSFAVQADGKVLVGGNFTSLGGQPRTNIGRLNADGGLDLTFNPGVNSSLSCLALQADNKILVGGGFTMLGGQPRNFIGRLNADGSLDMGFNPSPNGTINSLGIQADGKIVVGGYFSTLDGQPRNYIGRINADGSLDTAFNPEVNNSINCLVIQTDGKILVGGYFNSLGGQARTNIGRLNADGSVDSDFNPGCDGSVSSMAIQADGKILVGGSFASLGGQARTNIGRFNTDGTVDAAFNPGTRTSDGYYGSVGSLQVQADGKILVGGYFTSLGGQPRTNIGRLNIDGSADLTLSPGMDVGVTALLLQPDGKVLVGGYSWTPNAQMRTKIARLNNTSPSTQNLAYDSSALQWQRGGAGPEVWRTTFETTTNSVDWTTIGPGARAPGGWQLTGVTLPPSCTVRARGFINAGSQNSSSWFVEGYWGSLLLIAQPSSRTNNAGTTTTLGIVAGGTEPQYQWFKDGVALVDGELLTGAHAATLTLTSTLKADEGNYSVVITNVSGSITSAVARLTVIEPVIFSQPTNLLAEVNGSATLNVGAAGTNLRLQWLKDDSPLANATNSTLQFADLQLSDAGRYAVVVSNQFGVLTSDLVLLTVNGATIDPGFASGADRFVGCLAVQPDGKILVGGEFTTLGGQPRSNIGRLNADGSLDLTFKPEANDYLSSLAIQADGKILAGGGFYRLGGQSRSGIGRLNPDGSLDSGFNPGAYVVNSVVLQVDGKILVAGGFTYLGGQPRNYIGRLNSDGTLDSTFNPGPDAGVLSVAIQADGQIVVGGYFATLGGQPRSYLGRVNDSGALDTSFNPGADGHVEALAIQSDGKILVGGSFTTLAGQPRKNIGRLNPDGSLDTAFDPGADSGISCLAVQADGKILVGGYFSTLGGQPRHLGRLNPDGSVDATFNPASDSGVNVVALQADGEVVVGGWFTMLGGQPRSRIGRLYNTGPATEDLAYDGSTLLWHRGGTGTEVWRTTFEVTTNNLDWTSLGDGTRVPGGWQLTGASLPADCIVRARGFTTGDGYGVMNWFFERLWQPGPDLEVGLGDAVVGVGGNGCVPVYITSRFGLTNLSVVVDLPADHLTNFTLLATAPEIGSAAIELVGTTRAIITLSAKPGLVLRGSAQVASLCFDATSGQNSSFVMLDVQEVLAVRDNGLPVEYTQIGSGQVATVAQAPLLEFVRGNNGLPLLILHGQPGGGYSVQESSGDGTWTMVWTNLSLTDYSLALPVPAISEPVKLFRAVRAVP